jgi:hypothetical protein
MPLTKSVIRSEVGSLEVRSAETLTPSPSAATVIGSAGTRVHLFGFTTRCAPSSNASAVISGGGGLGGGGLGGGVGGGLGGGGLGGGGAECTVTVTTSTTFPYESVKLSTAL